MATSVFIHSAVWVTRYQKTRKSFIHAFLSQARASREDPKIERTAGTRVIGQAYLLQMGL